MMGGIGMALTEHSVVVGGADLEQPASAEQSERS